MKKILTFALTLSILASSIFPISSLALDNSRTILNQDGDEIIVRTLSLDELPDGIVPLEVDSVEEADALVRELTEIKSTESGSEAQIRASGDALIQREQYGGIFSSGSMVTELRVSYTTGVVNGQRGVTGTIRIQQLQESLFSPSSLRTAVQDTSVHQKRYLCRGTWSS